jgi:hypothetical protein
MESYNVTIMFVFLPNDKIYIERIGHHEEYLLELDGELKKTSEDSKPLLKDLIFSSGDNFYTHCRETMKYWTVGEEDVILVQESTEFMIDLSQIKRSNLTASGTAGGIALKIKTCLVCGRILWIYDYKLNFHTIAEGWSTREYCSRACYIRKYPAKNPL